MPKLPTVQDVKKVRLQATEAVTEALEQARTPLYAVLGAGDLASEAVRDYVTKARRETTDQTKDAQVRLNDLQSRLAVLQDRLVEVRAQVRTRVNELPEDVAELRGKLDAAELRNALENYVQSLQDLYDRLAARGETTVDKLRQNPQVKKAVDRVEDVADTTEDRVGKLVEDARTMAFQMLGRVGRRTQAAGEQAADRIETAALQVAEVVEKAGDEVADTVMKAGDEVADSVVKAGDEAANTTRKAASRPQPARTTVRKNTTPRKTGTKA